MLTASRKLARFTELSSEAEKAFAALCIEVESVPHRGTIVEQGTSTDTIVVMLAGWAMQFQTLVAKRRQITAFYLAGDVLNIRPVSFEQMDFSVSAIGPTQIVRIPRAVFREMLESHPAVAEALLAGRLLDEAILRSWISRLGQRNAHCGIAHLFCEVWSRALAAELIVNEELAFPISQQLIADACGLTAVHVNRVLQTLRSEGLIRLHGSALSIPDFKRLAAAADFQTPWLLGLALSAEHSISTRLSSAA